MLLMAVLSLISYKATTKCDSVLAVHSTALYCSLLVDKAQLVYYMGSNFPTLPEMMMFNCFGSSLVSLN